MLILLSTDICRHLIREQDEALLSALQSWSAGNDEILISSITYAELVAGAMLTKEQARHMQLVKAFCERLDDIVAWDAEAVDAYSDIQMTAMQEGYSLNMNDAMLAAHALALNAQLLTLSSHHFEKIAGLKLKLWA